MKHVFKTNGTYNTFSRLWITVRCSTVALTGNTPAQLTPGSHAEITGNTLLQQQGKHKANGITKQRVTSNFLEEK